MLTQNASSSIQEKFKESNRQYLEQTESRVESMLESIESSVLQFTNSYLIKQEMDQPLSIDQFRLVRSFVKGTSVLQRIDFPVNEVYLTNVNQDWVIDNSGLKKFSDWEKREQLMNYKTMPNLSFWVRDPVMNVNSQASDVSINFVSKIPQDYTKQFGLVVLRVVVQSPRLMIT